MFDFFLGILVGAILMDLLLAWRMGYLRQLRQYLHLKYKMFMARFP
jgi:hypothetical protein